METVFVNDYSGGQAEDYSNGTPSEYAFSSHFDILSYPKRLQPLRGMAIDTANTGIGNLLVGSDGFIYGLGYNGLSNPTQTGVWQRDNGTLNVGGYGSGDGYKAVFGSAGAPVTNNPFFVEFKEVGDAKTLIYADATPQLVRIDPTGSGASLALTFTSIGQGLVHPTDKKLYIPYVDTGSSTAWKIASVVTTPTLSAGVLTISKGYNIPCLSFYGNYLAVPATSPGGGNSNQSSVVYLWDRVYTTWNETIPWGGDLRVLNNLNGALIGVSHRSAGVSGTAQDSDAVEIKIYQGGSDPILIKQIVQNTIGVGNVTMTVNPNVNFVKNNRLYFSINIVPNDGSPSRFGLWSVGKNRNGRWIVTCERTENNTNTAILAAAMIGDFVSVVANAVGAIYSTTWGTTGPSTYNATSIYESCVNQNMKPADAAKKKKLISIFVNVSPISGGTLTVKYKVDDTTQGGNWVACGTYAVTGGTTLEIVKPLSGQFRDGKYYEFQISSTGGIVGSDWGYKYQPLKTNI